jgi:hypothetical protein
MASSSPPVSLRYPLRKIDSADDYLEIRVVQYKPPDFSEKFSDSNLYVVSSSDSSPSFKMLHLLRLNTRKCKL